MYKKFMKRFLDLVLSIMAFIILMPLMLIIYTLVRVKLGKPAIFKQQRPGKDEKIFTLYKFRTMTDEKDENGNLLPDEQRLTKFGKILRSTSLDELPELINIIKGDMSIVGPRPLLIKYLPFYTKEERKRHNVRPGLTGLAQINGRNLLNWDDRFKSDIKYIEEISFKNDMLIIFNTIKKVVKRENILVGSEHVMKNLDEERINNNIIIERMNEETLQKYKNDIVEYLKQVLVINRICNSNEEINKKFEDMISYTNDGSAIIIGAFLEKKLMGFIWAYKKVNNNERRYHINYFIVDEARREQGIGKKLIKEIYIMAEKEKIEKVELMVTKGNDVAVNFYKNQGFEVERIMLCKKI